MELRGARLRTAAPFDGAALLAFLAARAIPGVEAVDGGTYSRALMLPGGPAVLSVTPSGAAGVDLEARLSAPGDQPKAIALVRHLFGLDQDPTSAVEALGRDPALGPLVAARPGLRVPGTLSGFELAVRAVLGQQISVAAARLLAGRITATLGEPLPPSLATGSLTHLLPTPAALAAAPPEAFPMPHSRIRTIQALAAADPHLVTPSDADPLIDLWGIGPWTTAYIRMRLGDPDTFLPTDVAILKALNNLGLTLADISRWSPVRSFATLHLWASLA